MAQILTLIQIRNLRIQKASWNIALEPLFLSGTFYDIRFMTQHAFCIKT